MPEAAEMSGVNVIADPPENESKNDTRSRKSRRHSELLQLSAMKKGIEQRYKDEFVEFFLYVIFLSLFTAATTSRYNTQGILHRLYIVNL